jgi:hypothetical protein
VFLAAKKSLGKCHFSVQEKLISLPQIINSLFMKNLILVLFLLFFSPQIFAQKFFYGYGLTAFLDAGFISNTSPENEENYFGEFAFSYATVSAEVKYNIVDVNSEMALSVSASPMLGAMQTDIGWGHFRVPVYLGVDFGNLSTFNSTKDFGFGLGIGYFWGGYNLFGDEESSTGGNIAAKLSYRFFNGNNVAREVSLRYYGPVEMVYNDSNRLPPETFKADLTGLHLHFVSYLNY